MYCLLSDYISPIPPIKGTIGFTLWRWFVKRHLTIAPVAWGNSVGSKESKDSLGLDSNLSAEHHHQQQVPPWFFFNGKNHGTPNNPLKKIPFLEAGNTEFQTIIFRLHVGLSVCNLICFFFGNIGYRAVFFLSPTEPFFCLAMFICKYSAWVRSAQSLRKQNPVNSMVAKDLKSYLVL